MTHKVNRAARQVASSQEAKESVPAVIVQTMSGYEIWLDGASEQVEQDSEGSFRFRFVVTSLRDGFHVIRVEIPGQIQDQIRRAVGPSFTDDERFWYVFAHNALANALEQEDIAIEDDIQVGEVSTDLLNLAVQWQGMCDDRR
jgi:hypothetical protein